MAKKRRKPKKTSTSNKSWPTDMRSAIFRRTLKAGKVTGISHKFLFIVL